MLGLARWNFKLTKPDDRGVPLVDHLNQIWKATGDKPEDLIEPACSLIVVYIWEWFKDINGSRQSNGVGVSPLSHYEIYSWCQLTGIELTNWELKVLKDIDLEFLKSRSK